MNKLDTAKPTKTTIEKIKSISKALAVLSKIARIFCFVGIGVLTSGIIFLMLFGNMDLIVLNGSVTVHSPFEMLALQGMDTWKIVFMASAGITSFILLAILFRHARDLFRDISVDGSPFEMKQVKRIRKIAVFYLIISIMNFEGITPDFSLNFAGVLGALMFYCISLIFEYGCELQRESDETL